MITYPSRELEYAYVYAAAYACMRVPLSFAGFVVAGAPVGTPEFMREHVQREVAEAKEHLHGAAGPCGDPVRAAASRHACRGGPWIQAIMRTIRMCIAPSLMYTARTVPPEITTPYLRLLDRAVFATAS